jgi:hypothetical protein
MMQELKLLLVVVFICLFIETKPSTTQALTWNMQNGGALEGWHRDKQCKYQLTNVLKTFVKANNMNKNSTDNWSVYLPCGYNHAEKEFNELKSNDKDQKIFIIKGCDNLSRKDTLWKNLKDRYGDKASELMPKSYLLHNQKELLELDQDYDPGKVYILKKNIQRQQGLKMTKDKGELLHGAKNGYVVAQEMLQDPYVLDGRKTNCRVYLLVVCQAGTKSGYLYNNGFMYYTPDNFKKGSTVEDEVITAGLSSKRKDSDFYQTHPLTMQELQIMLHKAGSTSTSTSTVDLFARTGVLMAHILEASAPKFCNSEHLKERTTFQLFGCDIAFNDKLKPQLIEINKGPDLSSKSKQESLVKDDLMANIFRTVNIPVKLPGHGKMIKIWPHSFASSDR